MDCGARLTLTKLLVGGRFFFFGWGISCQGEDFGGRLNGSEGFGGGLCLLDYCVGGRFGGRIWWEFWCSRDFWWVGGRFVGLMEF